MIRLEINPRGAWRLIGTIEDNKEAIAHTVMQALADLSGNSTRISRAHVHMPPRVISHFEPIGDKPHG